MCTPVSKSPLVSKGPSSHLQFKSLLVCNALSALLRAWNVLISAGSPCQIASLQAATQGEPFSPEVRYRPNVGRSARSGTAQMGDRDAWPWHLLGSTSRGPSAEVVPVLQGIGPVPWPGLSRRGPRKYVITGEAAKPGGCAAGYRSRVPSCFPPVWPEHSLWAVRRLCHPWKPRA